ncbi:MAG: nicotinate-nucleotide adenylyltransferase [Proteobacteria bacterium]|nr:nicotinate-nucleotide adenylyltransferase [Pseudomonadota bacterium]
MDSGEWDGRRIGLLGGSFNPAHGGHLHISHGALDSLGLDALWWLVSPQNPLKPVAGMADFETRMEAARGLIDDRRIQVSDLERRLETRYTADTVRALIERYPGAAFVWIMGADNLAQIDRWKDWTAIFAALPIAVFDRPTYSDAALDCAAAKRFAASRIDADRARELAGSAPPAWVFVRGNLHSASATEIRRAGANIDNNHH